MVYCLAGIAYHHPFFIQVLLFNYNIVHEYICKKLLVINE